MAFATVTGSVMSSQIVAPAMTAAMTPMSTPTLVTRSRPRSGSPVGATSGTATAEGRNENSVARPRSQDVGTVSQFRRKHSRCSETERAERFCNGRVVPDDQRREPCRIEITARHPCDVVAGNGVHFRDELLEIGVGKVVERELRHRSRDLLRGLEVTRIPLGQRGFGEGKLVVRQWTRTANRLDLAK